MSKTFRLQDDTVPGFNNGEDWFYSTKYDSNLISAIQDPDGGKGNIPTSIPSPFARMELVNNAFKLIADSHDFEGSTVNHKLVSDTFDIAELLFNYNISSIKNNIKIVKWRIEDLDDLEKMGIESHKQFAKTLKLYVSQDSAYFNFQYLNGLYIIKYNNQVIGSTSPLTLFFPSADIIEGVNFVFPSGNSLFDDKYCPLYKRDKSFIEYIYSIKNDFENFSLRFNNFNNYLISCLEEIKKRDLKLSLRLQNQDYLSKVSKIYSTINTGTSIVEILGYSYKCQTNIVSNIESEFKIAPSRNDVFEKLPLVLIKGDGTGLDGKPRKYYNDGIWDQSYDVLKFLGLPINDRVLPGLGLNYPWLTISDFLEPTLIKVVYPINTQCYFDAVKSTTDNHIGFLLPIKRLFFDYFEPSYLIDGETSDGKPIFELNEVGAHNIQAILRIPIQKDYIEYRRVYYVNKTIADEENNEGIIQECQIGLTIAPFFKTNKPDFSAFYRIQFIDRDIKPSTKNRKYNLIFFDENGNTVSSLKKDRCNKEIDKVGSSYYSVEKEFDLVQIDCGDIKGFIIPKFRSVTGEGQFVNAIAIDFGTTSTHIELIDGNNKPIPLEFDDLNGMHIGCLMDRSYPLTDKSLNGSGATELVYLLGQEFLPERIGANEDYCFPIRSVTCEHNSLNILTDNAVGLGNLNIPFEYQKKSISEYNNITPNLKWLNYTTNQTSLYRLTAFLENIFFLIRNKIIINNGNLNTAQIIWFYPSSMNTHKKDALEDIMNTLHNKYISTKTQVNAPILESIAPYYYFKKSKSAMVGNNPFLLIDIGGESTDIVLIESNKPTFLTSFRFAGNSIFGTGLSGDCPIEQNGFVKMFESEYSTLLKHTDIELNDIFETLINQDNVKELISFLFSLENNKKIIDRNESDLVSFSNKLVNNSDLKIVFIVAYSAILFHIANIIKSKGISLPRYIGFSGNGSRMVNILTPNNTTLEDFTKCILETVTGLKYENNEFGIINDKNPKAATCKGGLLNRGNFNMPPAQEVFISSTIDKGYIPTYAELENNRTLIDASINEYSNFLKLLTRLNRKFNFKNHFGSEVNLKLIIDEILSKDIEAAILEGINLRKNEENDSEAFINETTLFYPLALNLNRLSYYIAEQNSNSTKL